MNVDYDHLVVSRSYISELFVCPRMIADMSEIVSHRSDSFIIRIFILHPGNYIRIHISETTIPFPKLISHNSNTLSLGQDGMTGRGLLQRSSRAIRRLVLYPFFIYPIYIDNVQDGRQFMEQSI